MKKSTDHIDPYTDCNNCSNSFEPLNGLKCPLCIHEIYFIEIRYNSNIKFPVRAYAAI